MTKSIRPDPRLLADLRRIFRNWEAADRRNTWGALAKSTGVSKHTVQRFLACTQIEKPSTGKTLAILDQIAQGMGQRLVYVPDDEVLLHTIAELIAQHERAKGGT